MVAAVFDPSVPSHETVEDSTICAKRAQDVIQGHHAAHRVSPACNIMTDYTATADTDSMPVYCPFIFVIGWLVVISLKGHSPKLVITWYTINMDCHSWELLLNTSYFIHFSSCAVSVISVSFDIVLVLSVAHVAYFVVCLITLECTHGIVNPLYHYRHSARDGQYECDDGESLSAQFCFFVAGFSSQVKLHVAVQDNLMWFAFWPILITYLFFICFRVLGSKASCLRRLRTSCCGLLSSASRRQGLQQWWWRGRWQLMNLITSSMTLICVQMLAAGLCQLPAETLLLKKTIIMVSGRIYGVQ